MGKILSVKDRGNITSLKGIFLTKPSKTEPEAGRHLSVNELIDRGKLEKKNLHVEINPKNDIACILYSSGTTGLPKGVMLTHYSMVANLCQTTTCRQPPGSREIVLPCGDMGIMAKPHPGDIFFIPFPYFHLGGIYMGLFWPLVQGATLICIPNWDPKVFLHSVQKYRVNRLILPPPVQVFLAKSPLIDQYDLSSVKTILCGAAPISKETANEVFKRIPSLEHNVQIYGMTELSPLCHSSPLAPNSRSKLDSIGLLVSSTSCKIVDPESGRTCGVGEVGEIWIKGPQVMKGYLNNEKATRDMITPNGWCKTGDIGHFDQDEYFYVSDRLKELIKVRGFQVAPAELEALILVHPSVAEVCVVGVPDPYAGELPCAYVVLKANHSASEEEIANYVANHVVYYKQLKGGVIFTDSIPKTASGKLLRRLLREKARREVAAKQSKV